MASIGSYAKNHIFTSMPLSVRFPFVVSRPRTKISFGLPMSSRAVGRIKTASRHPAQKEHRATLISFPLKPFGSLMSLYVIHMIMNMHTMKAM